MGPAPERAGRRAPAAGDRGAAPRREESLQQVPALECEEAADDLGAVIEAGMPKEVVHRPRHAAARIVRAEDDPLDLGQDDRAGALRARLERHVQGRGSEPVLAQHLERPPDREYLRVRRRIPAMDRLVMRLGDELPVADHDGPDRDFLAHGRGARKPECRLHAGKIRR